MKTRRFAERSFERYGSSHWLPRSRPLQSYANIQDSMVLSTEELVILIQAFAGAGIRPRRRATGAERPQAAISIAWVFAGARATPPTRSMIGRPRVLGLTWGTNRVYSGVTQEHRSDTHQEDQYVETPRWGVSGGVSPVGRLRWGVSQHPMPLTPGTEKRIQHPED